LRRKNCQSLKAAVQQTAPESLVITTASIMGTVVGGIDTAEEGWTIYNKHATKQSKFAGRISWLNGHVYCAAQT